MTLLAVFLFTLFIFILIGIPIVFSVGLSGTIMIAISGNLSYMLLPLRMFTGIDSFPLLAIPFFILAGELMGETSLTDRLIKFFKESLGFIRGSLAYTNVVASIFFAGISGSAVADISSIGKVLIPGMVKEGYDRDFSCAVTAASSTIGPIIPPSIAMVLFGVAADVSILGLFLGGFIPGVLSGLSMMGLIYFYSKKKKYPKGKMLSPKDLFLSFIKGLPALAMPFIILGGILGGIVTPTEASVIACTYALIVGVFIFRDINIRQLPRILIRSAISTGTIVIILGTASLIANLIAAAQIPQFLSNYLTSTIKNPLAALLLVNLFLLAIGCVMEAGAAIIILAPILTPLMVSYGYDPIFFGVIMVVNLMMGLITPPIGVVLYATCKVGEISLEGLIKSLLPFIIVMVIPLLICLVFPQIIMLLPNLLGR